jgi:lysophospholipase L1-like esterase
MECAGIGAMIDGENQQPTLLRRVLGTRNLSGQVDEILRMQHFPDLVLILIGHNNVDWTWWTSPGKLAEPDGELQRQSVKIRRNFARELERLIRHAARQPHKIAIVVYGLINFGTYFNARRIAEDLRTRDPQLYPHLETTYRYMNSFRPGYRENLTRLATMVNGELRTTVDEINLRSLTNTKVHLRYSDAMATADLSRVEFLHAVDGWHPSIEGHNVLADGAFADMSPSLNFLGIC